MQPERYLIRKPSLELLFNKLREKGKTVVAPRNKETRVFYDEVQAFSEISGDYLVTANTAKAYVFPRTETLFSYKKSDGNIEITEPSGKDFPEIVLWGTRPCDAAGFIPLNILFNWDYKDILFNARLEKLTVLSFSCTKSDEYCFCTSVGGGPGNTAGSDILFTLLGNGDYLAEILTPKGKELVEGNATLFLPAGAVNKEEKLADVKVSFNREELRKRLKDIFDSPVWEEQSARCLGCGSCAFVCPICSCFDIQDEAHGKNGVRVRCWDACGNSLFTMHTSGHNPRDNQAMRWRQRILHKFLYMPDRLQVTGCTGCGRCSRTCPADMNILEHVTSFNK